jgi:hypothetical protein
VLSPEALLQEDSHSSIVPVDLHNLQPCEDTLTSKAQPLMEASYGLPALALPVAPDDLGFGSEGVEDRLDVMDTLRTKVLGKAAGPRLPQRIAHRRPQSE